uniref:Transmembrane protein putative n=1 Tax=Albugo laibachii Nc14 TaxID=890382 RepID=F0W1I9_9STRA|nr:transmembrane protein putative [Albugo laibachii Nc14]|eukprot:CCA14918.1 transmembrane protein putative [Albugo laibachii Nc14]
MYGFCASCMWYFSNLLIMTYPFVLIYQFYELQDTHTSETLKEPEGRKTQFILSDFQFHALLWKRLGLVSVAISIVEVSLWLQKSSITVSSRRQLGMGTYTTYGQFQPMAWITGNTLFGITAFLAIPFFLKSQARSNRIAKDIERNSIDQSLPSGGLDHLPSARVVVAADRQSYSQTITVSIVSCVITWLVMFVIYSSMNTTSATRADAKSDENGAPPGPGGIRAWFILQVLSLVLCIILFVTHQYQTKSSSHSFNHIVLYSTIMVHLPLFLGHFCLRLFVLAELEEAEELASLQKKMMLDSAGERWISVVKFGISMLYLTVMQCYFHVMTRVVTHMAEPFAHPSLLYIGQLYYYMFWYIMVSSETPIDGLYWAMLLLNIIHIAFLNTGFYSDMRQKATQSSTSVASCLMVAAPIPEKAGVLVGICFQATTNLASNLSRRKKAFVNHKSFLPLTPTEQLVDTQPQFNRAGAMSDLPTRRQRRNSRTRRSDEDDASSETICGSQEVSNITILDPNVSEYVDDVYKKETGSSKPCFNASTYCGPRSLSMYCNALGGKNSGESLMEVTTLNRSSGDSNDTQLRPLYFLMKLAEQDNMADSTALILVPALLTILAIAAKPSECLKVIYQRRNMWLRCVCMFLGRLGSAFLTREIFAFKLKSRLFRSSRDSESTSTVEGQGVPAPEEVSTRLWIQRLMLRDFHRQFGYFTAVTMIVTFACFERPEVPYRFALLT